MPKLVNRVTTYDNGTVVTENLKYSKAPGAKPAAKPAMTKTSAKPAAKKPAPKRK